MSLDNKDKALVIQGIGAIVSAYGQYKTDKSRNKLAKEQFEYEKSLDARAIAQQDKAQKNFDDAFADSDFNVMKKKKKKYDALGNEIVDDTTVTA